MSFAAPISEADEVEVSFLSQIADSLLGLFMAEQ